MPLYFSYVLWSAKREKCINFVNLILRKYFDYLEYISINLSSQEQEQII